uniref:Methyltransferase domain-containing protein n=1 Tax=Lygus hesperus TaxID=30085 RepID=A0A0A9WQX0_LYGHE
MGDLYLAISSIDEDRIVAPLETAICVLTHQYLDSPTNVKIHLVVQEDESRQSHVSFKKSGMVFDLLRDIPPPASYCLTPVFNLEDGISCVAGLCSVLRQIIKHADEQWKHLLGFREACLVACAEVSMWTKFCEVDIVAAAKEVIADWPANRTSLPLQLARLEAHLSQPIRVHNVGKFKDQSHKYAEGPLFLVTDLILAVPVYVIMEKLQLWTEGKIALTAKWALVILDEHGFRSHVAQLEFERCELHRSWDLPAVVRSSLYKRDPTRYKPRHKIFTQQSDIESSMEIVSGVVAVEYEDPFGCHVELPPDIPLPDVPDKRLDRKIQQLSNLAKSTLKVSKANDLIVDFCSGSGHLGFIIAHALPSCSVVLLDNKEKSLDRARERREELGLNNVYIVQANLDYFVGKFQVGVSLHACGVASDLVIQKCLQSKASLVVCPCCYGGIQTNHVIQYPQSPEYKECGLTERGYIVLGHCADQAGTEQGERGMKLVDTDRCLLAKSQGYCVSLAKLIPHSCTTRNNLIVAVI